MLYSKNNEYPGPIPDRIRLRSGLTRTGGSYTAAELAEAGYKEVSDMPSYTDAQVISWDSSIGDWAIRDKTADELVADSDRKWEKIKETRDILLKESDWTQLPDVFVNKGYLAEPLTTLWRQYRNIIRDVTNQQSPSAVVWPKPPTDKEANQLFAASSLANRQFLVSKGLISE